MNMKEQIEKLLEEEYGAYYDGIVDSLLNLYNVSGFSADKVKQAYEEGQWDSEEGKGDKFNINNYR